MNNYDELFEKFKKTLTPEEADEISDRMEREKTNGEYYLIKAYTHDINGREKIAEICYVKADKLGFRESEKLHWYISYGSTLRWNKKLKESNEILTKGLELFKDNNIFKAYLLINKYKEKLITKEETKKQLEILMPNIQEDFWV